MATVVATWKDASPSPPNRCAGRHMAPARRCDDAPPVGVHATSARPSRTRAAASLGPVAGGGAAAARRHGRGRSAAAASRRRGHHWPCRQRPRAAAHPRDGANHTQTRSHRRHAGTPARATTRWTAVVHTGSRRQAGPLDRWRFGRMARDSSRRRGVGQGGGWGRARHRPGPAGGAGRFWFLVPVIFYRSTPSVSDQVVNAQGINAPPLSVPTICRDGLVLTRAIC